MLLRRHKNETAPIAENAVGQDVDAGASLHMLSSDALTAYATDKGIDIGQSTSQKGILKKILEATKTE